MSIDGGIFVGRDETTGSGADVPTLLARLDRLGVERALALSPRAIWFDEREGNTELLQRCAESAGRLLPVAAINLLRRDPFDDSIAALAGQGFVAAALVSNVFGWSFENYAVRGVARAIGAAGLPLMLCVNDRRDLTAAAAAAREVGGPVLLRWTRGSGYTVMPDLVAIARDNANVMLDVGFATQTGAIALMAKRLGAERLFLGSGLPAAHGGAPWFLLHAAELSDVERAQIAGGNLARVLGVPAPTQPPRCTAWEALRDRVKIDTHWHTSGWNVIEPAILFESLSRSIARHSIRLAITSSVRALSDDLIAGNDETASFLDREPRARGLVVVNPLQPERSLAELERWRHDPRFVGAKTIQDFYRLRLDDARYTPLLDRLGAMPGWPLMAHLPGMKEAASRHRDVVFVAAHSTWRHRELAALPNVWFDIATSTPLIAETDIRDLIDAVGPGRVLFSSDAPLMDPAWTLGKLAGLDLAEADLERIFAHNALEAFPRLRLET